METIFGIEAMLMLATAIATLACAVIALVLAGGAFISYKRIKKFIQHYIDKKVKEQLEKERGQQYLKKRKGAAL